MNDDIAAEIRAHAVAEYPRESCGLVVVVKGRERYFPCRNVAFDPLAGFVMDVEDSTVADDAGEVMATVHSHPIRAAQPSQADLVFIEASQLKAHIVHVSIVDRVVTATDINTFEPTGYVAPLVGREFHYGVLDCYTLIRDWFAREKGIELPPIEFDHQDEWWLQGKDYYMEHFAEAGFAPIRGAVQEGDVFLMQIRSPVANHAGVYIGDGLVLHHVAKRLSSRDVYDGYWQENTRLIVRHKDMSQ